METRMYQITGGFASRNNIPVFFVGVQLQETEKAIQVYGHGTLESQKIGACCKCGRTLTHPVSITLGIGPECGGHYWDWDKIGGYDEKIIEDLKIRIENILVHAWIPKACVKNTFDTKSIVTPPAQLIEAKREQVCAKEAKLIKYQTSGMLGIKITFPYDAVLIAQVKTLPNRKFHNETTKYWSCSLSTEAVEQLISWGFQMDERLLAFLQKMKNTVSVQDMPEELHIEGLGRELFPFQKKGVSFLLAKDGRALIGDDMGLGKTAQALAYLQKCPEKRPVIIIVPASLKLNWQKEALTWMSNPLIQILQGTKTDTPIIGELIIINYDILPAWYKTLQKIKAQVLILDECHAIKNNTAKRTKAVKMLAKGIPHILCLSGTPIINRPIEIFNAVKLIEPHLFPSHYLFAQKYCDAKHNGYGWDYSGSSNTKELNAILTRTVMLRRKKEDVLTELPDKMYNFVPMQLNNEKEYMYAERDFISYLKNTRGKEAAEKASGAATLTQIEVLKQLAAKGKLMDSLEWIKDFLDNSEEKLVVFAVHKEIIETIMKWFGDIAVKIDGSVSTEQRQNIVEAFQTNPKIRLFVGNIKAAGVGLTLTASSNACILELPWTPGELQQAEDRIHRIGQTKGVQIHYLLAAGTIEEKIATLLDQKKKVLGAVLDGIDVTQESLLTELINQYI